MMVEIKIKRDDGSLVMHEMGRACKPLEWMPSHNPMDDDGNVRLRP